MNKQKDNVMLPDIGDEVSTLILNNADLVKYVVGKMQIYFKKDAHEDIIGYGTIGLIEAAMRFDKTRGVKFNTFAVPRIKGAIIDHLRTQDVLPRSLRKKESEIKKVYQGLVKKLGYEPDENEIADELGVCVEELQAIQNKLHFDYFVSLENLHQNNDGDFKRDISNVLEDKKTEKASDIIENDEKKRIMISLIKKLPRQERLVITLYYLEDMLIKEISKVLKISESRVSQLHHKALFYLRAHLDKVYD